MLDKIKIEDGVPVAYILKEGTTDDYYTKELEVLHDQMGDFYYVTKEGTRYFCENNDEGLKEGLEYVKNGLVDVVIRFTKSYETGVYTAKNALLYLGLKKYLNKVDIKNHFVISESADEHREFAYDIYYVISWYIKDKYESDRKVKITENTEYEINLTYDTLIKFSRVYLKHYRERSFNHYKELCTSGIINFNEINYSVEGYLMARFQLGTLYTEYGRIVNKLCLIMMSYNTEFYNDYLIIEKRRINRFNASYFDTKYYKLAQIVNNDDELMRNCYSLRLMN